LEIGVVCLILGIIAAIAVPQLHKAIVAARGEAVVNDLRVFTQAFQHFVQEKGDWPAEDSTPGFYPPGMEGYLRESNWCRPTPIGGYYVWNYHSLQQGTHVRAAIALNSMGTNQVSAERIQLENIDRRMDDGNLLSGLFRLGFGDEPVYILEQ
jgi:type II secretory pathway pseudopilin PulG